MRVRRFLLGILVSASFLAGTQATTVRAADLSAEAEPITYVRVCDSFGNGFFYLPGGDTCLKISGRVRVEARLNGDRYKDDYYNAPWERNYDPNQQTRTENATQFRARGYLYLDARTNSEYGLVRAYTEMRFQTQDGSESFKLVKAFVQFGNFTLGRATSFFDFFTGAGMLAQQGAFASDEEVILFAYTAPIESFYITGSIENGGSQRRVFAYPSGLEKSDYENITWPDGVVSVGVNQGWGSAQIMAALHDNHGEEADKLAWALGAGVQVKALPKTVVSAQTAYTKGALSYTGAQKINDVLSDTVPLTDFTEDKNGSISQSDAWSIIAGVSHAFTSHFSANLDTSYVTVGAPDSDRFSDVDAWSVTGGLNWTPISGLVFGAEVQYVNADANNPDICNDGWDKRSYCTVGKQDDVVGTFRVQRTW